MIETRTQLKEYLRIERKIYRENLGRYQVLLAFLKAHPRYYLWKYVKELRIAGYFYANRKKNLFFAIGYFYHCRKKNLLGRKLGIELNEKTFDSGLVIYHTHGVVVNGDTKVGKNMKLHGNNCIGNNGYNEKCPVIGDNVRLGVGAKVIGDVYIADNITIAAGAVVVDSFYEKGITIGGIPARKIK